MKFLILLFILTKMSYGFFNSSSCAASQYFDTLTLTCKTCPTNTRVEPNNQQSCVCNQNFRKTDPYTIGFTSSCTSCPGVFSILKFRLHLLTKLPVKTVLEAIMLTLETALVHLGKL